MLFIVMWLATGYFLLVNQPESLKYTLLLFQKKNPRGVNTFAEGTWFTCEMLNYFFRQFPPILTAQNLKYSSSLFLQRLMSERDSLREANDELRCAQVQQGYLSEPGEFWTQM